MACNGAVHRNCVLAQQIKTTQMELFFYIVQNSTTQYSTMCLSLELHAFYTINPFFSQFFAEHCVFSSNLIRVYQKHTKVRWIHMLVHSTNKNVAIINCFDGLCSFDELFLSPLFTARRRKCK